MIDKNLQVIFTPLQLKRARIYDPDIEAKLDALPKRKLHRQDQFLSLVTEALKNKVTDLTQVDGTFIVKPINPGSIKSLVERAFFMAYSRDKTVLNDEESQKNIDPLGKAEILYESTIKTQIKGAAGPVEVSRLQVKDDKENQVQKDDWILCERGNNCLGSKDGWHRLDSLGLVFNESLEEVKWLCPSCQAANQIK